MPGSNYGYSTGEFLNGDLKNQYFDSPELELVNDDDNENKEFYFLLNQILKIKGELLGSKQVNALISLWNSNLNGYRDLFRSMVQSKMGLQNTVNPQEITRNKLRLEADRVAEGMTNTSRALLLSTINNRRPTLAPIIKKDPVVPTPKPFNEQHPTPKPFNEQHWLGRAKQYGFNSIDEVKAWQKQNGLVDDGMFGKKSLAKWNELNSKPKTIEEALQEERANGRLTVPVPEEAYAGNTSLGSSISSPASVKTTDNNSNVIYTNAGTVYNPSTTGAAKLWNAVKGFGLWLAGPKEPILTNTPVYEPKNIFMETGKAIHNTFGNANKHKNGGNINKYQQGGNMNEQELQLAVIGYIMATKKQPKSELEVQVIAQEVAGMKQSNPQQYQQLVQMGQQAQLQLAGAKVAALGSKLNYIRKIKGLCSEGEELVYMKEGGRVCPVCQKKAEKAQGGKKLEEKKKNTISEFKEKRKAVNPNDTVHVGGKPKSLTNADGSRVDKRFPAYTNEDYKKDKNTKDGQKRRMKADLVSSEKCGGKAKKAKKHFFGGPAEVMNLPLTELRPRFNYAKEIERPTKLKTPEQIKWEGRAENFLKTGKWEGGTEDRSQLIQNKAMLERIAAIPGRRLPMYQYMSRYVNDNFGPKGSVPSSRELISKSATIESPEEAAKSMRLNSPEHLKGLLKTYGHANVKAGDDGYYYHPAQAVSYAIGTN